MRNAILSLCLFACACAIAPQQPSIAIINATLIDGSGSPPIPNTTVVIQGDHIASVGGEVPHGATVINAQGLTLAPGFIDMHNHSGSGLKTDPSATTQVSQGITTVVLGQDGESALPIGAYLESLDRSPVALNVCTFVGQATLRERVMGEKNTGRAATPEEIRAMSALADQAMRDGAFGLSTGLEYEEAKWSTTEEVIALASATSKYGGIYMSHVRDEAQKTFQSFIEALQIGREAHVPVEISHIKMGSVSVWNRAGDAVRMIDEARAQGQDITADCYPYDAWHATIRVIVPSARHDDPNEVAAAIAETGGASRITIVNSDTHHDYEFKTLQQIADEQHTTPVDMYMRIVREGGATVVGQSMKEEDIRVFYQQPWVMVGSDGGIGVRHPRGAGTYPRVLGRYVRELHWLTLEEAIRKMTSLPASRLRLGDRGLIRPTMKADLVLFDAARVIDRSTFQDPLRLSEGIEHVFVNGVEVWRAGGVTGARPGRALRRP
ncbi:MAG: N-acyl-D-amino-acid deacylase family protein [Thermoanaerobaculia bacterium]